MSSSKKIEVVHVTETEEFVKLLEQYSSMLLVVDTYIDWCGPCELMYPSYDVIMAQTVNPTKRFKVITCARDKHEMLADEKNSCKPTFLLIENQKIVAKVSGANAPELISMVKEHMPIDPDTA